MGALTPYIAQVGRGQTKARDLTGEEAAAAMEAILSGKAQPFELGAFLTAMRIKEESAEELTAFSAVAQKHLTPVPGPAADLTIPTYAGKRQTFPALLGGACVLAACGVTVGLHGMARPIGRMSIADAITALGGRADGTPEDAAKSLERAGAAYVGIETFCPVMHDMLELRHEMGLRSCFHTIARLANPFSAVNQMVGVSHERTFEKLARAADAVGYTRAVSFRGMEGEAEPNPIADSEGLELHATGEITRFPIDLGGLGIPKASRSELMVENADAGAAMLQAALSGEGPRIAADAVVLTATLGLLAAGAESDISEAHVRAREAFSSGAAKERLALLLA